MNKEKILLNWLRINPECVEKSLGMMYYDREHFKIHDVYLDDDGNFECQAYLYKNQRDPSVSVLTIPKEFINYQRELKLERILKKR